MTKEDSEYHRKRGAEIVAQIQAAQEGPRNRPMTREEYYAMMKKMALDSMYEIGVKDERKRIVDMLLDMHAKEKNHNYYGYIANIIRESA